MTRVDVEVFLGSVLGVGRLGPALLAAWDVAEKAEVFAKTRDAVSMLDLEEARDRFRVLSAGER